MQIHSHLEKSVCKPPWKSSILQSDMKSMVRSPPLKSNMSPIYIPTTLRDCFLKINLMVLCQEQSPNGFIQEHLGGFRTTNHLLFAFWNRSKVTFPPRFPPPKQLPLYHSIEFTPQKPAEITNPYSQFNKKRK